jgi:Uma2 family endonuclease
MTTTEKQTIEAFIADREELPDGGRWTELQRGQLVTLEPPTVEHGTAVLNLTKALAEFVQRGGAGYACFELGLILARNPDTVRFPAVSYYVEGPRFAEADKVVTDVRPALVAEIASTNDRRRGMHDRVTTWLDWGVTAVWVIDPHAKEVHTFEQKRTPSRLAVDDSLAGGSVLNGFELPLSELFKQPAWYR